ncbi:MAG: hypothetical protein KF878_12310 [Planctomycetes bacterium]|nr:hypothetical protein [Planctomycetota bacterium]
MPRTATLLLALLLAAPARAQDAPPAPPGPAPLDHPGLHTGDAAAAMEALLRALEAAPTDAQVPLVLVELRQVWELVPGGQAACAKRLRAVAERMGPHPLRDDVQASLAELLRATGDVDGLKRLQVARGFVREFLVAGAFGLAPSASLEQPFEPELAAAERDVDPTARFRGLRGEVGWLPLTVEPPEASAQVGRATTARGAVTYALAHVNVPAATEGWLVYTGPSAKLWLNRGLVTVIDRGRERLDQELMVPVRFAAGWNRLLVKTADGRGARFALRLTDARGGALAFEGAARPQPVDLRWAEPTPPRPSDALARLAADTRPARQALYAQALAVTGRGEEAYTVLDDLRRSTPALERSAWFWLLVGDAAQRADHLPGPARRDQARAAYERALALDPRSARARRRLSDFAVADDRTKDAVVLLEQVLADHPGDLTTRLRLIEVLMRKRWLLDAERALDALEAGGPPVGPVLELRAQLEELRGRPREAQAARERLFALDRGKAATLLRRIERALKEGDRARADGALDELLALGWGRFDVLERRAEVARAFADRAGEVAARRARLAERPWDLDLHVTLAELLAQEASTSPAARAEAMTLLEGALGVEPGRHAARRLLRALQGQGDGEDRFWEEWAPDVEKVLAEAPPASHWPKAATACLFDQTVTRIYPDGSSVDVVHQLFKVLDATGIQRYGSRPKGGELLRVRTFTPSGQVLEPIQAAGNTFEMPGLAPGAVVEHAYRVERDAPGFQYTNGPFYFQDPELTEPFWLSRWVLFVHQDAPMALVERNMKRPGITHTVEDRGEWRVHVFTATDRPRFEVEPLSPERDELLPWVKVVERRSLEEIGAFYRELARQGAVVTTQVARKAAELTADLDDDAEKARALYRFVQDHVTRPGDGAATAAQVLSARAGSKTTLLLALLEAARVPHKLVVAGSSPAQAEAVDWTVPEPGHLRNRLIRVEPRGGEPVYVFPEAARLAPYGRLPAELWGAPAYVCERGGGVLEVLPIGRLDAEEQRSRLELTLEPGGKARVEHVRELPAFDLYRLKEAFARAPAAQLRSFFAQQANALFPGARVLESGAARLEEPGVPFGFRLVAEVPGAVRARGDGALTLQTGITPTRLRESLGAHRRREFDLVLRDAVVMRDTARIDLGPYACPRLPPDVVLKTKIGMYSLLHVREGDGRLRVERVLILRAGRVTPEEYPAFHEFLGRIDEAERRTLALEERR